MIAMPSLERKSIAPQRYVPPFETGDRMDQKTFHELYLTTPKGFKAELIGGAVHMASPVSIRHGRPHRAITAWLHEYTQATEGTEWYSDVTVIMSNETEPQPDLSLLIYPEAGGQTTENDRGFLVGAPELAIEVAVSSASIDLNAKKRDYEKYGVVEYLVVVVKAKLVHWFVRGKKGFVDMTPDSDGLLNSRVFPGLWLDPTGVFDRTPKKLLVALKLGLASTEHAKFRAKLQKKLDKPRKTS